jgi:hypothetical protein
VNPGFGLIWFNVSNTCHAAFAANAIAFSAYLMGFAISSR